MRKSNDMLKVSCFSWKSKMTDQIHELQPRVDELLVANTTSSWRKIALVIGLTMSDESLRNTELSDAYYLARVQALVQAGALEATGDIEQMRSGEVRLAPEGAFAERSA